MAVLDERPFTRALRTAPHLYEEQLQELFDLVDLDKTGTIDVNEGAGALIQAVGDVYLNRSMQKASSIDVHDAAALPALLRALPAAARLMMLVDDDDDCALDQKEFANGLRLARAARALGDVEGLRAVAALPAERTRLNRMFATVDINGDGKLDINEWVFFVEQFGIAPLLAQYEMLLFSCMLVVALEKEKAAVACRASTTTSCPPATRRRSRPTASGRPTGHRRRHARAAAARVAQPDRRLPHPRRRLAAARLADGEV